MKAIFIGIILACLANATGAYALFTYAVLILEKTGTFIDPYYSSVMFGVSQLFGTLGSTHLSDTLGRKALMVISLIGTVFGLLSLCAYIYLMEMGIDLHLFTWLPVASLSFVVCISSAGVIPLCTICTAEILPSKVRCSFQNFRNFSSIIFLNF